MTCLCGKLLDKRNKSGMCIKCLGHHRSGIRNPYYKNGVTNGTFCVDCGKKVYAYSKRCIECDYKARGARQRNEKNPLWNGGLPRCIDCGALLTYYHKARCKKCFSISISGAKNHNWKGGASNIKYLGFGKALKNKIRNRDGNRCQICGVPQIECLRKLHVHHIDYNKKNHSEDNLISLCHRCHAKTCSHQERWINYFDKVST